MFQLRGRLRGGAAGGGSSSAAAGGDEASSAGKRNTLLHTTPASVSSSSFGWACPSAALSGLGLGNNTLNTAPNSNKLQLIWGKARIQWNLLSTCSKRTIVVVICLALVLVVAQGVDLAYQWTVYDESHSIALNPPRGGGDESSSFAVVINTYKRPAMLRDAVQHYAQQCGRSHGVSQVFVIWAEVAVTPPTPDSLLLDQSTSTTNTQRNKQKKNGKDKNWSQVVMVRVAKDSLNSRFLPLAELQSQAVFMVDDDVRVDCESLMQGFAAWRAHPQALVGYYPRLAAPPARRPRVYTTKKKAMSPPQYIYHAWPMVWWRHEFNFILTKASFLHKRYLDLYSNPSVHPVQVLDYVDQHKNCEDVAMALLVANVTSSSSGGPNSLFSYSSTTRRPSPNSPKQNRHKSRSEESNLAMVYVQGHVSDKGMFNGISTSTGHFTARSACLDDLTALYLAHGWNPPLESTTYALQDASWIPHAATWQYQPSNVFEWGALSNVFQ